MITRSPQRVAEKPTRWSSPGLRVSSPLDHSEREADTTATRILTMPTPSSQPAGLTTTTSHIQRCPGGCNCTEEIHRQPQEEDEEELQLKPDHTTPTGTVTSTDIASLGTGQALPKATRSFFEPRFSTDLSHVRIHTNRQAGQLAHQVGAKAFTYHQNIAFAPGHYQPHTITGKHLLAHELTHTIQQKHGEAESVQRLGANPTCLATEIQSIHQAIFNARGWVDKAIPQLEGPTPSARALRSLRRNFGSTYGVGANLSLITARVRRGRREISTIPFACATAADPICAGGACGYAGAGSHAATICSNNTLRAGTNWIYQAGCVLHEAFHAAFSRFTVDEYSGWHGASSSTATYPGTGTDPLLNADSYTKLIMDLS
ncbi:MAG TPA: DUF4157 domain-containing protein [Acidimicrobiia bacterium]|nr:DUF4157 domain-containing protein [Acidimicrobiia bacterium]